MTRDKAIEYIEKELKNADVSKLANIICGLNTPLCSYDCPLKDKFSTECKKIEDKPIINQE